MDINAFQEIINGWDIWLSVFIMILIVVLQSAFFLKTAIKEAKTIGISADIKNPKYNIPEIIQGRKRQCVQRALPPLVPLCRRLL